MGWLPNGIKNGLASGVASVLVKGILQPLDTIKTLQQVQNNIGPIEAGYLLIRERGWLSLWSGLGVTVFGSSPSIAVYFGIYSSTKEFIQKIFPHNKFKVINIIVSAAIGNSIASVVRVPFEVIKQRLQTGQYTSLANAFISITTKEGIGSIFSNGKLTSQIARDVPYAVITLVAYEAMQSTFGEILRQYVSRQPSSVSSMNQHFLDTKFSSNPTAMPQSSTTMPTTSATFQTLSRLKDVLCGALAGGLGAFLSTPMDVIKTRMMTTKQYGSLTEAVFRMAREEGILVFFSGVTMRLAHKIPANGLFFLIYEITKEFLGVTDSVTATEMAKKT